MPLIFPDVLHDQTVNRRCRHCCSHAVSIQKDIGADSTSTRDHEGHASDQSWLVRQIWQDYSLESSGHEEDLPTDLHGRVTFPARTIRAPLIWRLLGPLASIVGQGVHASFGVHTHMFPLVNKDEQVMPEVVQRQPGDIWFWIEP
jgi:hypothetical protein